MALEIEPKRGVIMAANMLLLGETDGTRDNEFR